MGSLADGEVGGCDTHQRVGGGDVGGSDGVMGVRCGEERPH